MAIIKIRNPAIDLDAAEIPNLDTAKITTGELANARVADLPTSKITSGTFADARISESSVTQHAATYDDNKLQTNVALLGFKTAVNGSLAKYNLVDQIVDEYEDNSGIDTSASTNERLTAGVYDGTTQVSPTVTGGSTAVDGDYTVHTITADANFVTDTNLTVDYLINGAGGGGGNYVATGGDGAGGGGAGGYYYATSVSLSAGTFAAVIGVGGSAASVGGTTTFNSITAAGGGTGGNDGAGGGAGANGTVGGSGGGTGNRTDSAGTAGSGGDTTNRNDGGGDWAGDAGAGGGGSSAVGGTTRGDSGGGHGGAGTSNSITGTSILYAQGGGGGVQSGTDSGNGIDGANDTGSAGTGGFGSTPPVAGTANRGHGGGGGGQTDGASGGSGVVIIRRLTYTSVASGGNLTLQSNDTTASTANPDYADMVCLIENAEGTATLDTDIKGYISEDSGSTWTQGNFVDEGSWGTNKKIIAFHDLDISAQSGSSMCYKITTHNQSAGSKETKIHATSIGWR